MNGRIKKSVRLCAGEPYRVFFPVALVAGVAGVALWPLFYGKVLPYYPSFAHARLMIEGFVGGFAIGFLGTALPKMLSTPPLRVWQVAVLLCLHLGYCTAHAMGETRPGDAMFAAMMALMLGFLAVRAAKRRAVPPPGMVLTLLGLLCGVFGAVWWALFTVSGNFTVTLFAQRLLYQAFILLPLLGVGSFIFPMILGTPNRHAQLAGARVSGAWLRKAGEAFLVGLLLIATYWIEVKGKPQMMSWTRFALCAVWLGKESGWMRLKAGKGVMTWSLRAGIVCLLGALVATALLQKNRVALEHTLYIGAFGLITMVVATRVIFGHSGQGHLFQKWIKPLVVCTGLVLLGMATRVSADFMTHINDQIMMTHHIYAAVCWIVVSVIWGVAILPSVRKQPFPSVLAPRKKPDPAKSKPGSVMDMDFRK